MGKKIFVIEDDPSYEMLLCRLIQGVAPGAEIICEESAERAIETLENERAQGRSYDLIISDIFLAGRATGLDLIQTCRENFPGTPLLITSSMPLLQFFNAVGRDDIAPTYLAKPLIPGECHQILEAMLSRA